MEERPRSGCVADQAAALISEQFSIALCNGWIVLIAPEGVEIVIRWSRKL